MTGHSLQLLWELFLLKKAAFFMFKSSFLGRPHSTTTHWQMSIMAQSPSHNSDQYNGPFQLIVPCWVPWGINVMAPQPTSPLFSPTSFITVHMWQAKEHFLMNYVFLGTVVIKTENMLGTIMLLTLFFYLQPWVH